MEDACLNGSLECFRLGVDKSNGKLNGVLVSHEDSCEADSSLEEELALGHSISSSIGRFSSMSLFELASCVGSRYVDIASMT